jgi:hypothetical protein
MNTLTIKSQKATIILDVVWVLIVFLLCYFYTERKFRRCQSPQNQWNEEQTLFSGQLGLLETLIFNLFKPLVNGTGDALKEQECALVNLHMTNMMNSCSTLDILDGYNMYYCSRDSLKFYTVPVVTNIYTLTQVWHVYAMNACSTLDTDVGTRALYWVGTKIGGCIVWRLCTHLFGYTYDRVCSTTKLKTPILE